MSNSSFHHLWQHSDVELSQQGAGADKYVVRWDDSNSFYTLSSISSLHTLIEHSDVATGTPPNNAALIYNLFSSQWGFSVLDLNSMSDVSISTPTNTEDYLVFNGTSWLNKHGGGIDLRHSADQTIPTSYSAMSWDTEDQKYGSITHSTVTANSEITFDEAGVVRVNFSASALYVSGTGTIFLTRIQLNTGAGWVTVSGTDRREQIGGTANASA